MPSPIGHTLVGLGVAFAALLPRGPFKTACDFVWRHRVLFFCLLIVANLPDIDYVPGILSGDLNAYHHHYTHTMGWVVIICAGLWLCGRAMASGAGWKMFLVLLAVMSSHLVADWLNDDGRFPYGVMMFWPLSSTYYMSPVPIFWRLMKKDWVDIFQWYNALAVAMEVVWGMALIGAVLVYKRFAPMKNG